MDSWIDRFVVFGVIFGGPYLGWTVIAGAPPPAVLTCATGLLAAWIVCLCASLRDQESMHPGDERRLIGNWLERQRADLP